MQLAFWLVALIFVSYLSAMGLGWREGLLRVISIFSCHIINFYVCYSFLTPRYVEKKQYGAGLLGVLLLLLFLTPLRYFIEQRFVVPRQLEQLQLNNFRGILAFILFSEISIAGFAILLRMAVSSNRHREQMIQLKNTQLETELRFLKNQMSPHFLFNTINNIYSLALTKSDHAPAALMKLSGLLRYLLYESHDKVTLSEEMEALYTYCELFRLRYEQPLDIIIQAEPEMGQLKIESMLLVPLMENAIKHSGIGIEENARIGFSMHKASRHLVVRVVNTKASFPATDGQGGIGLANIRKRLQLLYPGTHRLLIEESNTQFSVVLEIPAP